MEGLAEATALEARVTVVHACFDLALITQAQFQQMKLLGEQRKAAGVPAEQGR